MAKKIMREFSIGEISGVDRPAQKGAVALIMKRDDGTELEKNGAAITTEADGHTHIFALIAEGGDTIKSGITNYAGEGDNWHAHPWIMMDGGPIIIGAAGGHTHEVAVTNKNDKQVQEMDRDGLSSIIKTIKWTSEMVKEAQHVYDLAKGLDALDLLATEEGELADLLKGIAGETLVGKNKEITDMSTETKNAEALADLQKKLDRSEAIGSMNDVTKAHFEALKGDAADAFLAKSQAEREAEVAEISKAAEDKDPVVYKTAKGLEIRKSDGAVAAALAEEADILSKSNSVLLEAAQKSDLEKRAAEFTNIPGSLEVRVALLKGVDSIEDETLRAEALKSLKAQNDSLAPAFDTVGKAGGSIVVPGSGDEQLDVLVKKYQEAHPDVSEALAMDAVLKTAEGSALYTKSFN